MELQTLINDGPMLALLGGGGIALLAMAKLWRGTPKAALDEELPVEEDLKDLANRAKWLAQPKRYEGLHLREMVVLWRDPTGYLDEHYARKIRIPEVDAFYKTMVTHGVWFQNNPYTMFYRSVITQLLELLDKTHPSPSVAKVFEGQTDTDGQWGASYSVLSKVTLLEHLLNVSEMGVSHLLKTNQSNLIPNALVALLAHDIGKLPVTQAPAFKGRYGTGDHPIAGAKLLSSLEHFSALPKVAREDILQAVIHHHNPNPKDGSLHQLVQMADRSSRHAEFRTRNQVHIAPGWVQNTQIMSRDINYSPLPPEVAKNPDIREAMDQIDVLARFSTGVMGDMNNLFYTAEKADEIGTIENQPMETIAPLFTSALDQRQNPDSAPANPILSKPSSGAGFLPEIGSSEPPPLENQGIDDPSWERVQAWVERGLGEGDTVDATIIQKKFRIKLSRAEAIFEALVDNGFLVIPEEESSSESLPEPPPVMAAEASRLLEKGAPPYLCAEIATEQQPDLFSAPAETAVEPIIPANYAFEVPMQPATIPPEIAALLDPQSDQADTASPERYLADISSWFRPDAYMSSLGQRIDRAWKWNKPKGGVGERELVEVTETGTDGTFYWGVTTKHHTWLNIMALRHLAAEQLVLKSRQMAIALFESKTAGGDPDFQDMVLKAIVNYFQKVGIIDTGLLPMESPYYSLNCEVVLRGGTKQGSRRMVPFHWHNFYQNFDQVQARRKNYPFVARIEDVNPIVEIKPLPELQR